MAIRVIKIKKRRPQINRLHLQFKERQLQIKERRLQIKEGLLQEVGATANVEAETTRQTSEILKEAADMDGGPEVAEVLLSLARALKEDAGPKAAASVLEEIGKVAEKMDKESEVSQAVQQVEIMIRGTVVLRRLACIDPMDRDAFINVFKCAFDKKQLETANAAATVAAETTRQASDFLRVAADTDGGQEVAEVLLSLARALQADDSPEAAASVLVEIGKVAKNMGKESEVSQAVQQVEIMIRDTVVLRCLACIDPMNREAFIKKLKEAFCQKELERDFKALLLLAHKKITTLHGLPTFKSATEERNARTGKTRPRKRTSRAMAENPAAEDNGIFCLECGHMTNDIRENCSQCLQHDEKMGWVVAPTSPPERDGDAAQDGGGGDAKAAADPALESGHGDATASAASSSKSPSLSEVPFPAFVSWPELPSTDDKLLLLLGLNGVLFWRDYKDQLDPSNGKIVQLPGGKKSTIFIRPGAAELLRSILWKARCDFAFVSSMRAKYCIPCTQELLRHATDQDWTLEEHEAAPFWASKSFPQVRFFVLSEVQEAKGVKNLECVWKTLRDCGLGWYTEQNTKLLDKCKDPCSDVVHVVGSWRPDNLHSSGLDLNLSHKLLAGLDARSMQDDKYWHASTQTTQACESFSDDLHQGALLPFGQDPWNHDMELMATLASHWTWTSAALDSEWLSANFMEPELAWGPWQSESTSTTWASEGF